MKTIINVCGIGPGGEDQMTANVRRIIGEADTVLTSLKDNRALKALNPDVRCLTVTEILDLIERETASENGKKLAVAASGDTGFHSIATTILRRFPEAEISLEPGIGTISYFMAKIGRNYEDLRTVSFHGISGSA
ncbi:MAG: cobalt-precorrin-7 (C(5))-methyltransferase, partial [Firmicutes bacterium]|nr:cobalt-precorrin-7 (C(5))-methyltransferase [Bacillota bacterium]